jgi:DNA sulfur modification protein DndC
LSRKEPQVNRNSAFAAEGIKPVIEQIHEEIRGLYLNDEIPWVVGYSGGKDSTATLQLIWNAITGPQ